MAFLHRQAPAATPLPEDPAIAVSGGKILVRLSGGSCASLPKCGEIAAFAAQADKPLHVGILDGAPCWLYAFGAGFELVLPDYEWREIRPIFPCFTPSQWRAIDCALALFWWRKNHLFCGACGAATVESAAERSMRCPKCGSLFYPTQSPAVIVAVTKGERLLLAHNRNFRAGLNSVIAGFVDPGETFEEAVARELNEEVGIEIRNLMYVKSQSWPFPNSLMIAFRAEWKSGELRPDGAEIETADWFERGKLPEIPFAGSIARQLIDGWAN
jgi:NAD+ diphosphatase